ncbi:hypothetical protein [Cupriavidus consociatus]|uniref:hypothetical protein n=1 Tax=Cupriavidus consociatus TaxID=2821357 RepID=UPI001AE67B67|nr:MULTISPECIES: hypothetical protein [unclassified Cupriavidus]MBP0624951.1 hypothetical protein [Cupriavidus sp. LEh25]
MMSNLADEVLEAHGGLERWNHLSQVTATIVTGGAFWAMKGLIQDPAPRTMTVSLHEERASVTPFGEPHWRTAFEPGRIAIETTSGETVKELRDPRRSFDGHVIDSAWNPLQRAYFNGYALWTYLTTPFLIALPGFEVTEIEPWREGSETWRGLRVRFPANIESHCELQDFYFGDDRLVRRHDYHVDIAGGFAAAQYLSDHITADGIVLPSRRRAYLRNEDLSADRERLMVAIDLGDVRFS